MQAMNKDVVAFSDDGRGVQKDQMIKSAMLMAKKLGKVLVCHCEDNSLLKGGYIHDGEYAKAHGHKGICSESEYGQVARDLKLVKETGCAYHVCHISTKETVELIRQAKKDGLDVTCETAPHYLILDDGDLQEDGRFKMNPPIRGKEDKKALIEGLLDGTIDMIATDHAPHSAEEKSKGLESSVFGIVGIETSFALMYTYFVKTGLMTLERLLQVMAYTPAKRFNIDTSNDFSVWDLEKSFVVDPETFLSKGKSTPFTGYKLFAENLLTVKNGKIVYKKY
jgi:dihydroorotase